MLNLIANGLIFTGTGILLASLIPMRQLLVRLPPGGTRVSWYLMAALCVLFIASYIAYARDFWGRYVNPDDLISPAVFLGGACFVASSVTLGLNVVNSVRRVSLLERESTTDALSGLYNRRYLNRRLEEEMEKAYRYGMPLSILLIDVDQFKRINDTLGHQVGDHVLCQLGRIVLQTVRGSDIAGRYGGDELLIVAPNTSLEQAGMLAERLRLAVASQQMKVPQGEGLFIEIPLTVCIGAASCLDDAPSAQTLVESADEALYRAKAAGRNQVALHPLSEPVGSSPS